MFENPRRGRQAKNVTTNVPKILDLKSSSEQIFFENWRWVPLRIRAWITNRHFMMLTFLQFSPSRSLNLISNVHLKKHQSLAWIEAWTIESQWKWWLCIITWLFADRKTLFLMQKPERYTWLTLTRFAGLSMKFMSLRVYVLWSLAGKSHCTISKLSRSSTKAKERLVFRVCMKWPRFFASRCDWFI